MNLSDRYRIQIRQRIASFPSLEKKMAGCIAVSVEPTPGDSDFSAYLKDHNPASNCYHVQVNDVNVAVLYRVFAKDAMQPIRPILTIYRCRVENDRVLIGGADQVVLSPRDLWLNPFKVSRRDQFASINCNSVYGKDLLRTALDLDLAVQLAVEDGYDTTETISAPRLLCALPMDYTVTPDWRDECRMPILDAFRPSARPLSVLTSPGGQILEVTEPKDGFREIIFDCGFGVKHQVPFPAWVQLLDRTHVGIFIARGVPYGRLPEHDFTDVRQLDAVGINRRGLDWLRHHILQDNMHREEVFIKSFHEPHPGQRDAIDRDQGRRAPRWDKHILNLAPYELVPPTQRRGRLMFSLSGFVGRQLPTMQGMRPFNDYDQYRGHIFVLPLKEPFPRGKDLQFTDQHGRWSMDLGAVGQAGAWLARMREGEHEREPCTV